MFSQNELLEIVTKSAHLRERMFDPIWAPDSDHVTYPESESLWALWKEKVAQDDEGLFEKRLLKWNLDPDTAKARLTSRFRGPNLPQWTEVLQEMLLSLQTHSTESLLPKTQVTNLSFGFKNLRFKEHFDEASQQPSESIARGPLSSEEQSGWCEDSQNEFEDQGFKPKNQVTTPLLFEGAYLSFKALARQKLNQHLPSLTFLFDDFLNMLMNHLAEIATKTLYFEFTLHRKLHSLRWDFIFSLEPEASPSTEHYDSFIHHLLHGGWKALWMEYSVLARLMAESLQQWLIVVVEFATHFLKDQTEIQKQFFPTSHTLELISIEGGLSDYHNHGRTVFSLKFSNEGRLIYKPKNVEMDTVFGHFANYCIEGLDLDFKIPKTLPRENYGWVEWIQHLPCKTDEEGCRYYERAGMLLALLYVLGANDAHFENLIAHGEYPVLIDLETLFHRHPLTPKIDDAQNDLFAKLNDSVFKTGLLPDQQKTRFGSYDPSGLGQPQTEVANLKWIDPNTDRMRQEKRIYNPVMQHVPLLNGEILKLETHLPEFEKGFARMYRNILQKKECILAKESCFFEFQRLKGRMVYQATMLYALLLQNGYAPDSLRLGLHRSFAFEYLFRRIPHEKIDLFFPFFDQELRDLERMDIPFFESTPITRSFFSEPALEMTPFEMACDRIKDLNENELNFQINLIRLSLKLSKKEWSYESRELPEPPPNSYSKETWIDEALQIASLLEKKAHSFSDGSLSWYSFEPDLQTDGYRLSVLNHDLYSGTLGLSLFFSALGSITQEQHYHKLAQATLKPYLKNFQNVHVMTLSHGIGGIGSDLYALSQIAKMSGQHELMELAKQRCLSIHKNFLNRDTHFDIVLGAAGTLMGVLSYYQNTQDPMALEKALLCGDFLLEKREMTDSGYRAWGTIDHKHLSGFSHGVAGIAYALIRLYEKTQEKRFLDAALESIEHERSLFYPENANWIDLRCDNKQSMTSWCHGAPGIGLARLATLPILDTPEIRKEIAIALSTTDKHGCEPHDHLCCGNLGRLEFLFTAAIQMKDEQRKEAILHKAAAIALRGKTHGYGVRSFAEIINPSFFTGLSGIGYTFLRFAEPEKIPNVLLLET